ncbi:hypothetical protein GWK47_032573 [Chionoecetes opilio]|uniref:Uncharacterized protein n=1 Tax=Chionoecetes opilio TaxID=41210 RepID=A0A8J4YQ72_CHIOP|nr:hypothetical protein GWK47_032573 [Chionoecetes opilio]
MAGVQTQTQGQDCGVGSARCGGHSRTTTRGACQKLYEKERDGVEARYKRDSRYSKCSEDRWPDRGSSSSSNRKRSRSPTDTPPRRRESKNYSPPSRTSREYSYNNDAVGYGCCQITGQPQQSREVSRSPGRQSLHSRSPIRKRPPHSRSPETQRVSTPDRAASAPATKKTMCGERQTPPESDPLGAPMKEMQELGDDLEENGIEEEETKAPWVRSAPADLYYQRDENGGGAKLGFAQGATQARTATVHGPRESI